MFSIEIQELSKTYKNGHQALKEINLKQELIYQNLTLISVGNTGIFYF